MIEKGLTGILVFSPLAFGSVHVWSSSLLQISSFIIVLVWMRKLALGGAFSILGWEMVLPAGLFAALVLFQLVPLPSSLARALSPAAAAIYGASGESNAGQWHPLSIHPDATLHELLNFLAYLSLFVVVANHYSRRDQIVRLFRVIIGMGCVLVVIAVLQKAYWNGRLFWFYPISPALQSRISYIWGPYVNRNHFAGYLEMVIPLTLGYVVYQTSRFKEAVTGNLVSQAVTFAGSRRMQHITVLLLAVAFMSGALFATLSRGGILGLSASITIFVVLMRSRRALRKRTGFLLIIGLGMMIVGLFAASERIEDRFVELADESRIKRTFVWRDLASIIKDYPFMGTGFGTFDRIFPRYQTRYSTILFEHAENDYLEVMTDTGLIGFALIVTTAASYFVTMIKLWRARGSTLAISFGTASLASCTAIAVHSLTDFNLRVPANAVLITTVAALGLVCVRRANGQGETLKRDR